MTRRPRASARLTTPPISAERVTSTMLHTRTRETLDMVRTGECVAITHYNEVEGYLVAAERLQNMASQLADLRAREQELHDTLPLLLGAVKAGVALPSETLERLVPGLDDSWRAVATFAAKFPVRLSSGEDGEPITRGRLRSASGPIEDSGEDDDLNLAA